MLSNNKNKIICNCRGSSSILFIVFTLLYLHYLHYLHNEKKGEKTDYKAIGERRQLESETIREYGNKLIQMITTLFPEVHTESIDNWLKKIFADGVYNQELGKKIKWKMIKKQRKQEKFNIQDAIEYAIDKNEAYENNEVYEQDSDTQSSRNVDVDYYKKSSFCYYYYVYLFFRSFSCCVFVSIRSQ